MKRSDLIKSLDALSESCIESDEKATAAMLLSISASLFMGADESLLDHIMEWVREEQRRIEAVGR